MTPDIVATLKHGKVLTRKLFVLFWSFLMFFILATVFCLALIIVISTSSEIVSSEDFYTAIVALCGTMFFVFIVIALLVVILVRDGKAKKEIREWLVDAVRLKAYCEETSDTANMIQIYRLGCVGNVKVTFNYCGDKRTARSKLNMSSGRGTGKVFARFVNNEITILYSPKFKQVMFLGETSEQSGEIL